MTAKRRTRYWTIKFYPEELEALRRCAEAEGQTIATWIRTQLRAGIEYTYDDYGLGKVPYNPDPSPPATNGGPT